MSKKKRNLMSQAAYARHTELSPGTINGYVKDGKIKIYDGMVDQIEADKWRAENISVDARRGGKAEDTAAAIAGKPEVADASPTLSINRVKAAHESIKLQAADIDLRRKRGQLVERVKVQEVFFNLFRAVRDSFTNWPSRVASQMAGDLDVDPKLMQEVLDKYITKQLEELVSRDLGASLDNVLGGTDADESDERLTSNGA